LAFGEGKKGGFGEERIRLLANAFSAFSDAHATGAAYGHQQ